jgi:hypothetical protein
MHGLWNDQSMGHLIVTKGVPISAWHGILSNTPSHAAIHHCYGSLKSCHHRIPQPRMLPCPVHWNSAKTMTSALQLEVHLVTDGAPQQCP